MELTAEQHGHIYQYFIGCLGLYVLAASRVISGTTLTVHSKWLYSGAPLGNQTTGTVYGWFVPLYSCLRTLTEWYRCPGTMIQIPTQTHYPDTEQTSPFPIVVPSTRLCSNKHSFVSDWFHLASNSSIQTLAHPYRTFIDSATVSRIYSKPALNRPTTGPTLIGPLREVVGLRS